MASMARATMMILALCCCMISASTAAAPAPAPSVETDAAKLQSMSASAFVYSPGLTSTPNMSASASTQRMLKQWPALEGMGVSQTAFRLGACALRPPHYHLRATGLLYLISGSITVGFTSEDGTKSYVNNLTAGSSAIFPQGLVHYQQNLGCEPAQYTISYNSEDPGTQLSVPGLYGLPEGVVTASLGLNTMTGMSSDASMVLGMAPRGAFIPMSDAICVSQCSAAMGPAVSSTSTAGR